MPWLLLIGHTIGDYFAQTKWMAQNKVRNDRTRYYACLVHCLVYSVMVVAAMSSVLPNLTDRFVMFCIAFVCHFPIDKWSLAKHWMGCILDSPKPDLKLQPITMELLTQIVLWWFVYLIIDNTAHLLLMVGCIVAIFTISDGYLTL